MTLSDRAVAVLSAAAPDDKVALSRAAAQDWQNGRIPELGTAVPPLTPARPDRPEILPPGRMKRRGAGGAGRAVLIHALAHIEFNAIDLAWDIIARFPGLPLAFYADWVRVAADETEHFVLLSELLAGLGHRYGDFPAHGGLWEAAHKTASDLQARLALVPLTLEARALDTAPALILKLRQARDETSVAVLQRVLDDEIIHVAIGKRWFDHVCALGTEPAEACYHRLIAQHFPKGLKPPFNQAGRTAAGLPISFYQNLAETPS